MSKQSYWQSEYEAAGKVQTIAWTLTILKIGNYVPLIEWRTIIGFFVFAAIVRVVSGRLVDKENVAGR